MKLTRRVLRAGAVLAVALAAGHTVQTIKRDNVVASIRTATVKTAPVRLSTSPASAPLLPASASLASGVGTVSAIADVTAVTAERAGTPSGDCSLKLSLAAEPGAMIHISLLAPCNRGDRVVLRHAGLNFTGRTGADGSLSLRLPAMGTDALVSVYLPQSEVVLGSVLVPDLEGVQRFAVQWSTNDVFDLRIGEDNRIFVGGREGTGEGVRILALGDRFVDQPLFAEVYTYPTDTATKVDVVVEVLITAETCGRDLAAETVISRNGTVEITPFTVTVPQCGSSGDILVLKNLAPDMKIAAAN